MKINGHPLREHIRLVAPLLGFISAVWALRLIAAAAGLPMFVVRTFSVTVTSAICILFAVLMIHSRRFGSYANVVAVAFLLACWEQLLIVGAIAFSVLTGIGNVFTRPEYSAPEHIHSVAEHIIGHLTFGVGLSTLFGAGMGCALLWMLRRMAPIESAKMRR